METYDKGCAMHTFALECCKTFIVSKSYSYPTPPPPHLPPGLVVQKHEKNMICSLLSYLLLSFSNSVLSFTNLECLSSLSLYLFVFQDVFPDKGTERKILSFAIKCPSEGCEWTGELRSKEVKSLLHLHCSALSCRCWSTFPHFVCAEESFFFHLAVLTKLRALAFEHTETDE